MLWIDRTRVKNIYRIYIYMCVCVLCWVELMKEKHIPSLASFTKCAQNKQDEIKANRFESKRRTFDKKLARTRLRLQLLENVRVSS